MERISYGCPRCSSSVSSICLMVYIAESFQSRSRSVLLGTLAVAYMCVFGHVPPHANLIKAISNLKLF